MRDQMLNHGLDKPLIDTDTGYFQVTFPGPGENLDRIRVPETRLIVTPAVEAKLNVPLFVLPEWWSPGFSLDLSTAPMLRLSVIAIPLSHRSQQSS